MGKYNFGKGMQIPNLNDLLIRYLGYKKNGLFVEVGAFDCYQWSNTYGLAMLGWRGLYFEPQKEPYLQCLQRFSELENIEVVNKALSNWHGQAELFLGGSLSTIDVEQKDRYLEEDWSRGTGLTSGAVQLVPVSTLASELGERGWPASYDLLVIDVEGSEVDVLNGNDINAHKPTMAIVETHAKLDSRLAEKAEFIDRHFYNSGYGLIQEDHINSIYVLGE